ncbi:hypothetical protein BHM03_00059815, partial [Ensete ventricosum]
RPHREFARRFVKGIRKLAGNTSGDHQKKTERLTARMPEVAGLAGHSCGNSSGLLPVISRRAPSELPDPFGESPNELPTRSHYIVQTRPDA